VIPAHRAELVELIFGAALFMFWSALTIAMVRLIDRSRVDMQD
jgi:alkylhydroperoxidase family enzyme